MQRPWGLGAGRLGSNSNPALDLLYSSDESLPLLRLSFFTSTR